MCVITLNAEFILFAEGKKQLVKMDNAKQRRSEESILLYQHTLML